MIHATPRRALLCLPLFVAALHGCAGIKMLRGGVEAPEVVLAASKVVAFSARRADLLFDFDVRNPNAFALTAHSLNYRLTVRDKVVAEGSRDTAVSLPAGGDALVQLPIQAHVDPLMEAAVAGFVVGEIPYRLEATLTFGSFLFRQQIDIVASSILRLNLPLGLANHGLRRGPIQAAIR